MESITRFLQDVWDGDGTKAFSEIRPDEVAKKLTRNSMGAVVANLKRLLREAVSRDPRILARIKKDECNRIVNDILDLFGSDSLYDFVLSVTEKSNALGAAASARQELLGPDRSRLVHYNQEFPELFDRQGNQRAGYQHPSKIFTIFLFSKILGRPVSKSDLIGPEAVSQYQTQRIVTALSARIEERMRLVYERYSLEAPAITAGAATGTFLPVAGTIGVTVAPAVIDLFVADWRPRALQQAYESCLETIAEIRGIAHKNRS
ncbi:MAG TPA: hypothetical protein PK765_04175 [bacterium]|nr:hypothetical protein [bacterium]